MTTRKLILTGAFTGKTMNLRGYQFTNGVHEAVDGIQGFGGLVRYMGRSYQAYLEGSLELVAAQKRDGTYVPEDLQETEASHGERDLPRSDEHDEGKDSPEGDVQPDGGGTPAKDSEDSDVDAVSEEGSEGSVPSGNGRSDAGVPDESAEQGETVREDVDPQVLSMRTAILKLDPEVDEHWLRDGRAAMAAVEQAFGSAGVTRKDVEQALPDWNREKARELASL